MIGIRAIATYVPTNHIDNIGQAKKFGERGSLVVEKIGALKLPLLPDGHDTSDMVVRAVTKLLEHADLVKEDIDALVVVTQNPDGFGLPHTAAIAQTKLGLSDNVAAFDLSLGCSGYVYGLSVLRGLMEQANLSNGVLVTADPYSKIIDRQDRSTSLLFGDASTATWLSRSPLWEIGTPILCTDGSGRDSLRVKNNRKLEMDGRRVFSFAVQQVPKQINSFLHRNNLRLQDVDCFCLHQGSSAIVNTIAKKFPEVSDRFILDLELTGNTISSSIPLILEKHVLASNARTVLISGFGVGLSWGTNFIRRNKND